MKNLKMFEAWNTPPEYEETPQPQELGREIGYTEGEQLFTPVFTLNEEPGNDGQKRQGNAQPDFDIVMDKTPEHALWLVDIVDDAMPDSYKVLYDTSDGEEHVHDTEAILNFATDEFKAGRFTEGIEKHQEDYAHHLIKLVTPEDVDFALEDLYDYLRPGHASYVGKARTPRPGYNANQYHLRSEEVSRVKRAITILLRYKKQIESNTVGGFNKD